MNLELAKTRAADADPRARWERAAREIAETRLRGMSADIAAKVVEPHWRTLDDRLAELSTSGHYSEVGAAFDAFDNALFHAAKAEFERQRKAASNGINERGGLLHYRCWDSMEFEALLAWAKTWPPGETLQTIEWFFLETNTGRRKTRDELRAYLRPPSWSRTDTWLSQFVDDTTVRQQQAAAAERARLERV